MGFTVCLEQPLIYGFFLDSIQVLTPVPALVADAYSQDTLHMEIVTHLNKIWC